MDYHKTYIKYAFSIADNTNSGGGQGFQFSLQTKGPGAFPGPFVCPENWRGNAFLFLRWSGTGFEQEKRYQQNQYTHGKTGGIGAIPEPLHGNDAEQER